MITPSLDFFQMEYQLDAILDRIEELSTRLGTDRTGYTTQRSGCREWTTWQRS